MHPHDALNRGTAAAFDVPADRWAGPASAAHKHLALLLLTILLGLAGCARDNTWRMPEPDDGRCQTNGNPPFIDQRSPELSLAYIEFTERGNVFNRGCLDRVYDHVREATDADIPVALFVFVHGWKHNASPDDGNVKSFQVLLERFTASENSDSAAFPGLQADSVGARRRVIGIYVGWRGAVFSGVFRWLENLTFWNRKRVAEDIGKGGVTEILLALRTLVYCPDDDATDGCKDDTENVYVIAGHSFGAGIVLSALNEHLLGLVEQATISASNGEVQTERFNDALLLLNPAIEANQLLQTKELIATNAFSDEQDVLMHVISSRGDKPTHVAFPAGRSISSLFWNKQRLVRQLPTRIGCDETTTRATGLESGEVTLRESELLVRTVGNYPPFWTGLLDFDANTARYRQLTGRNCPRDHKGRVITNHLYAPVDSPVQNIYTDKKFISDHNDIFNPRVVAYAAAIVSESLALPRQKPEAVADQCLVSVGSDDREYKVTQSQRAFDFGQCFAHWLKTYCEAEPGGCP